VFRACMYTFTQYTVQPDQIGRLVSFAKLRDFEYDGLVLEPMKPAKECALVLWGTFSGLCAKRERERERERKSERERERKREREKERTRETERPRDRETERQRQRQKARE
jgi:hypothetical protein